MPQPVTIFLPPRPFPHVATAATPRARGGVAVRGRGCAGDRPRGGDGGRAARATPLVRGGGPGRATMPGVLPLALAFALAFSALAFPFPPPFGDLDLLLS